MMLTDNTRIDPRAEDRVQALGMLEILDSPPDREFDLIAQLAAELLGCPIALVSLIDAQRQWFKARYGLQVSETPLEQSFCRVPVRLNRPLIVPDAQADPQFRDNPLVKGDPNIRFYAGVPLRIETRPDRPPVPIGTLCAIDNQARQATSQDLQVLETLGQVLETLLAARLAEARARHVAEQYGQALAEKERLHRQLQQAERLAQIGSWRFTVADERVEWSPQLYSIFELPPGSAIAVEEAYDFFPPEDRQRLQDAVDQTVRTGRGFDVEVTMVTAMLQERRVRSLGEMELQDGQAVAVFGVFQDITERHELETALREAADVDELTRLGSRKRCNAHLDQTIARCQADGAPLVLVLIDLDHFKAVNDQCGHAMGDEVLRRAGQALRASWLAGSFAGRMGGDEFVLLLTEPDLLADLPGTMRRLLATLRQDVECPGAKAPIAVSGTLGAAWLAPDCMDRATLMSRADQALYQAKNAIRGTAAIAGQEGALIAS
ncbi:diguanylate cyclase domain-containing protein [Croceibacterium ferulae]|uniref:diguanylate cyclase domain-containing protein n=1 Tax=Croceibacterium ferulae TaxID=1854641 RepID=UPI000EACAA7E|nr:diguanylate cyclase [Croceibacterium ferulae]